MTPKLLFALTALFATAGTAARFDPREFRPTVAGPPTEIAVLGSPHLSGMGDGYKSEYLAPLLDRLAAWKPQIITIEALSGTDCDFLQRYKAIAPGVADDYCLDTTAMQKAVGLDTPGATAAVATTLKAWPAAPTAGQRRHLAALFLAAGERASAVVQWYRLPEAERHEGDGLTAASIAALRKSAEGKNENYAIGARLAARLGLERVYAVDDHSADTIVAPLSDEDYGKAIKSVWAQPSAFLDTYKAKSGAATSPAAVLDLYRYMNEPATNRGAVTADMGGALKLNTAPYWGRQYVAWWETRNLRMVANIRSTFGNRPGARVLSIVGATHKAYFEAYLDMMSEVHLVDVQTVLN